MNQAYREAVTQMEEMKVQQEYILGWQGGFLGHPLREEQRHVCVIDVRSPSHLRYRSEPIELRAGVSVADVRVELVPRGL